uniref:non-specific protein-tyrosine kinase n=1 Tax=Gongylonema pulchrum TaxID=637853 RepID=A0A183DFY2_9BILA
LTIFPACELLLGAILKNPVNRPDYYILHENIVVKQKIGDGAFGDVFIGELKKPGGNSVDVAIKMLKGVMTKKERANFMMEAKIMRRFNHENIVNLLGVAVQEYPVMIVLELCPNGALDSKLRKNPSIPVQKLIQYTVDACRGMVYLSGR